MIPRTFPSSVASNGSAQMIVYFLPSVSGLTRWVDYIPVKFTTVATAATENTYNQNGYIPVVSISSIAGATPFKEYVPVYLDSSATDAEVWKVNITGFIPVGTAGIGGAALYMDFAATTTLDPRVTFSRTTNATVTGSNGLIQNAPMNLLTFSEQFDNAAWTKTGATVTANTSASPTGTSTADTLTATAGTSAKFVAVNATVVANSPAAFSVYVKAGTWGFVQLVNDGDAQAFANFNVTTGVAGTTGTKTTAAIVDLGNGWYRCTALFNSTVSYGSGHRIYMAPSASAAYAATLAAAGTETLSLWGAQLEQGSTATTYNPTTVKNLLGYTEHFDNAAWTKSNATITSGFTDIYGQPFAQSITSGAANATVLSSYTAVASTPYTFSVYLQRVSGTGNVDISVDGTNWVTQTLTTTLKRFTVTGSPTAGAKTPGIRVVSSGDVIIAFGAQLSDSASVDPYVYNPVAAPSAAAYYGPRFDYDPVTLAPKGLLIEEQRTNLVLRSEEFDNASWGKANATIAANQVTAPDGSATVDKITGTASSGEVYQVVSKAASAITYSWGVYVKAGTDSSIRLYLSDNATGQAIATFNLLTGAVSGVANGTWSGASAVAVNVGNGWYRCVLTATSPANATALPGLDSVGNGNFCYIWGAQLEAGAFATSYIPTVASQVTRAADSASMIGNNFARWYNGNTNTFYTEVSYYGQLIGSATETNGIYLNDGAALNQVAVRTVRDLTAPQADVVVVSASSTQLDSAGLVPVLANTVYRRAFAYATNSAQNCINGALDGSTTTSFVLPTSINRLSIPGTFTAMYIKRIAYYNRRLSNTELQSITA